MISKAFHQVQLPAHSLKFEAQPSRPEQQRRRGGRKHGESTPLIVIPRNELDKVRAQLDPSARVKDGRSSVADEIGGHDLVLRVLDDALVRTFSGSFDSGFDLFVGRGFLDAHDKVDDGYTQGGHTECEATTYEIQDKRK
jgi:hypothetical protein